MNSMLRKMIDAGTVTLGDLIEAINGHEGRETASRDIVTEAKCDLCGHHFPRQPQDSRLAEDHGHRVVCYRKPCRRTLKAMQNSDTRKRRQTV